jgi:hypothetical protein
MNTRIFFDWSIQKPSGGSDILLYFEDEVYPYLFYFSNTGRIEAVGSYSSEIEEKLKNGAKAVYCYVEALASLAFEIAEQN